MISFYINIYYNTSPQQKLDTNIGTHTFRSLIRTFKGESQN